MASDQGYSGTPQLRKLGIKPGLRLTVVGADPGWAFDVEPVEAERVVSGATDVLLIFVREPGLLDQMDAWGADIFPAGMIWVAWPRKAAGHVSDVTENAIREAALARGLVDVKVAALDHDWSALKLVWRKENRT